MRDMISFILNEPIDHGEWLVVAALFDILFEYVLVLELDMPLKLYGFDLEPEIVLEPELVREPETAAF